MNTFKAIFDGKTLQLLEPVYLERPHRVEVTVHEAIQPDAESRAKRRARILKYAGTWLDLPTEIWENLQDALKRREGFFPKRIISW